LPGRGTRSPTHTDGDPGIRPGRSPVRHRPRSGSSACPRARATGGRPAADAPPYLAPRHPRSSARSHPSIPHRSWKKP